MKTLLIVLASAALLAADEAAPKKPEVKVETQNAVLRAQLAATDAKAAFDAANAALQALIVKAQAECGNDTLLTQAPDKSIYCEPKPSEKPDEAKK